MLAHLHTGEPAPPAYIRHLLFDRYKWTRAEVRSIPLPELYQILAVLSAEAKYHNRPKKPKK